MKKASLLLVHCLCTGLVPKGLLSLEGILGGGKSQPIPGKLAVIVARGAHLAWILSHWPFCRCLCRSGMPISKVHKSMYIPNAHACTTFEKPKSNLTLPQSHPFPCQPCNLHAIFLILVHKPREKAFHLAPCVHLACGCQHLPQHLKHYKCFTWKHVMEYCMTNWE